MYHQRTVPAWRWGFAVRIPGCITQAIMGAFVLGLMIVVAVVISALQFVQTVLPH